MHRTVVSFGYRAPNRLLSIAHAVSLSIKIEFTLRVTAIPAQTAVITKRLSLRFGRLTARLRGSNALAAQVTMGRAQSRSAKIVLWSQLRVPQLPPTKVSRL